MINELSPLQLRDRLLAQQGIPEPVRVVIDGYYWFDIDSYFKYVENRSLKRYGSVQKLPPRVAVVAEQVINWEINAGPELN